MTVMTIGGSVERRVYRPAFWWLRAAFIVSWVVVAVWGSILKWLRAPEQIYFVILGVLLAGVVLVVGVGDALSNKIQVSPEGLRYTSFGVQVYVRWESFYKIDSFWFNRYEYLLFSRAAITGPPTLVSLAKLLGTVWRIPLHDYCWWPGGWRYSQLGEDLLTHAPWLFAEEAKRGMADEPWMEKGFTLAERMRGVSSDIDRPHS